MANPNRTDYEGPELSGPGILWINSKVTDPESLPVDKFTRWYEDVHIPDIIAARDGGIISSWRYQCANTDRAAPFLAVYKCPNMGFIQSTEFKSIPMTHPTLPGNGPIHRFADFDARFLEHIETWSSLDAADGRTATLVSEAIEPASDLSADAFNAWFRSEHIQEVAKLTGWRRTSRFELVFKKENKDDLNSAAKITPHYLALHEFADGSDVVPASGVVGSFPPQPSVASKAVLDNARKVDVAAFNFLRGFGNVGARWVDTEEKRV
ncbi:hypothetical protein SEUCBS139899_006162 [Sporothrix eucalyptigena]|uniref:EthD domain-containing protein n=1 Tax=Sporothrix eucalyptigena TaxID=1812306 RepID=A0ABP0AQI4_9PEZI